MSTFSTTAMAQSSNGIGIEFDAFNQLRGDGANLQAWEDNLTTAGVCRYGDIVRLIVEGITFPDLVPPELEDLISKGDRRAIFEKYKLEKEWSTLRPQICSFIWCTASRSLQERVKIDHKARYQEHRREQDPRSLFILLKETCLYTSTDQEANCLALKDRLRNTKQGIIHIEEHNDTFRRTLQALYPLMTAADARAYELAKSTLLIYHQTLHVCFLTFLTTDRPVHGEGIEKEMSNAADWYKKRMESHRTLNVPFGNTFIAERTEQVAALANGPSYYSQQNSPHSNRASRAARRQSSPRDQSFSPANHSTAIDSRPHRQQPLPPRYEEPHYPGGGVSNQNSQYQQSSQNRQPVPRSSPSRPSPAHDPSLRGRLTTRTESTRPQHSPDDYGYAFSRIDDYVEHIAFAAYLDSDNNLEDVPIPSRISPLKIPMESLDADFLDDNSLHDQLSEPDKDSLPDAVVDSDSDYASVSVASLPSILNPSVDAFIPLRFTDDSLYEELPPSALPEPEPDPKTVSDSMSLCKQTLPQTLSLGRAIQTF